MIIKPIVRTNNRWRWLHVAAWGIVAFTYLCWLFRPTEGAMIWNPVNWDYLPDQYLQLIGRDYFRNNAFDMGYMGIINVLGYGDDVFSPRLYSNSGHWRYTAIAIGYLAVFGIVALLFLPLRSNALDDLPARRKPNRRTSIAASFMLAVVTTGLISLCTGYSGYWTALTVDLPEYVTTGKWPQVSGMSTWTGGWPSPLESSGWPATVVLGICWLMWSIGTLVFWRRNQRYWALERMTLWLLLASSALLLIPLAIDIAGFAMDDARNGRGIYTARVLAATVLLWAWGCRIVLLFQLRRYEQAAAQNPDQTCYACGYDLRGTIAAGRKTCPECGAGITLAPTPAAPAV